MKNKRVVVLGSTGMLGHAVCRVLREKGYEILPSVRKLTNDRLDGTFEFNISHEFYHEKGGKQIPDCDFLINCIGAIVQKQYSKTSYISLNASFPLHLADVCQDREIKMIHPTTDCVFSGKKGSYVETDIFDPDTDYGHSKKFGEPSNCMVLRTSIIGRELNSSHSLLEWAISQRGKQVDGFTNHLWNGITNVEFAHVCHDIIKNDLYDNVKRHVFSSTLSKHEMLCKFNERYDLRMKIRPIENEIRVDRSLSTIHDLNERLNIPTFDQMIREL